VNTTREQLIARLDQFSDQVLLDKWAAGGLTESGKDALAFLLQSRGIMPSSTASSDASDAKAQGQAEDMPAALDGSYETLLRTPSLLNAQIICARLDAEGIPAIALDQNMANAELYRTAIGGIRIQVPRDQITAARDILDRLERGEYAIDDTDAGDAT
jgi:hypothetical protein